MLPFVRTLECLGSFVNDVIGVITANHHLVTRLSISSLAKEKDQERTGALFC